MCFPFFARPGPRGRRLAVRGGGRRARPPRARARRDGRLPAASCRPTSCSADALRRRRRDAARSTASTSRTAGWGSTSARDTAQRYAAEIAAPARSSGTARWAPSSWSRSQPGTRTVAEAVARATGDTVVGGGDSRRRARRSSASPTRSTHLSTGGGASLELIEGKTLPGVEALSEHERRARRSSPATGRCTRRSPRPRSSSRRCCRRSRRPTASTWRICAPFTALGASVDSTRGSRVEVYAQNMHQEAEGAFTGEISAPMLTELDVHGVVLGHSERRELLRRDRPGAAGEGRRPRSTPVWSRSSASARPRTSASAARRSASSATRCRRGWPKVAGRPARATWSSPTSRSGRSAPARSRRRSRPRRRCAFVRALVGDRSTDAGRARSASSTAASVKPENAAELLAPARHRRRARRRRQRSTPSRSPRSSTPPR